jgi:hypothetical protein
MFDEVDLTFLPRYKVDVVDSLQRQLASDYDPNRDHAVLEQQQTRAIRRFQLAIDPHIFGDEHKYTGGNVVAQIYIRAQDLLLLENRDQNVNPRYER